MVRRSLIALALMAGPVGLETRVFAQASKDSKEFAAEVAAHFKNWDVNRDKTLSRDEIDVAVANPKIVGKEAAAVAALKRTVRNSKLKLPELTETNIHDLALAPPATDHPNFGKLYADCLGRLGKVKSRNLFADGPPRLDTIHQGKLGNCFCLAPIGAMLHRDPKQVAAMFVAQSDGTYLVTLGTHRVTVAPPTDAELAMTSSNEHEGVWLNLYEKAVGASLNEDRAADKRVGSPIDALAKGGSAGTMLSYITGHAIERFSCKFAHDATLSKADREAKLTELRKHFNAAVHDKRLVTAGTTKTTTPGMTPNHAYAVLNYDAKTDMLRVWNPHGNSFTPMGTPGLTNGYARTDGVFSVPLPEFVQIFSGLAFELKQTAAK